MTVLGNVLCLARSFNLKLCGLSIGSLKYYEVKRSPVPWTNFNNEARSISYSSTTTLKFVISCSPSNNKA